MKSIKEKSEEYAYTNWQSDDYHEGDEFDAIGHTEKTFQAGANYVLNQIGEWLRTTDYTSYKPAEHDLWVLIEQLKN